MNSPPLEDSSLSPRDLSERTLAQIEIAFVGATICTSVTIDICQDFQLLSLQMGAAALNVLLWLCTLSFPTWFVLKQRLPLLIAIRRSHLVLAATIVSYVCIISLFRLLVGYDRLAPPDRGYITLTGSAAGDVVLWIAIVSVITFPATVVAAFVSLMIRERIDKGRKPPLT